MMNSKKLIRFFKQVLDTLALRQPLSSDHAMHDLAATAYQHGHLRLSEWLNLFIRTEYPISPGDLRAFKAARIKVENEMGTTCATACASYLEVISIEIASPLPWAYRRHPVPTRGRQVFTVSFITDLVKNQRQQMLKGRSLSQKAVNICDQIEHRPCQAFYQDLLTKVAFEQNDFKTALDSSELAVALWQKVVRKAPRFRLQLANSYRLQGRILQNQPHPHPRQACQLGYKALEEVNSYRESRLQYYYKNLDALDIRIVEEEIVIKHLEAHIKRSLSGALRDSNRPENAKKLCIEALQNFGYVLSHVLNAPSLVPFKHRFDQSDVKASIGATYETLAGVCLRLGEIDQGYKHCHTALSWFREFDAYFSENESIHLVFNIHLPSRTHLLMTIGRLMEARAQQFSTGQMGFEHWRKFGTDSKSEAELIFDTPEALLKQASKYYGLARHGYRLLKGLSAIPEHPHGAVIAETVAMQRRGVIDWSLKNSTTFLEKAIAIFEKQGEKATLYLAAAKCDKAECLQKALSRPSLKRLEENTGQDMPEGYQECLQLYRESVTLCRKSMMVLNYHEYHDVYKGQVERAYLCLIGEQVRALSRPAVLSFDRIAANPQSAAFQLIEDLEDLRYFEASSLRTSKIANSIVGLSRNPAWRGLSTRLHTRGNLNRILRDTGSRFLWIQNTLDARGLSHVALVSLVHNRLSGRLEVYCQLAHSGLTDELLILSDVLPTLVAYARPRTAIRKTLVRDLEDLKPFKQMILLCVDALRNHPNLLRVFFESFLDALFVEYFINEMPLAERDRILIDDAYKFVGTLDAPESDRSRNAAESKIPSDDNDDSQKIYDLDYLSFYSNTTSENWEDHLRDRMHELFVNVLMYAPPTSHPLAKLVCQLVHNLGGKLFQSLPIVFQEQMRTFGQGSARSGSHGPKERSDPSSLTNRPIVFVSACSTTIKLPFELVKIQEENDIVNSELKIINEEHWRAYLGLQVFMPRLHSVKQLSDIVQRQPTHHDPHALLALNSDKWVGENSDGEKFKFATLNPKIVGQMLLLGESCKLSRIPLAPTGKLLKGQDCNLKTFSKGLVEENLAFSMYFGHGISGKGINSYALTMAGGDLLPVLDLWEILKLRRKPFPGTIFIIHSCSMGHSLPLPGNRLRGFPILLLQENGSCVIASSYPVYQDTGIEFIDACSVSMGTTDTMAKLLLKWRSVLAKKSSNPLDWCLLLLHGNPWSQVTATNAFQEVV